MLHEITENQFDVYVHFTRSKYANVIAHEVRWYKNEVGTVFGLILYDLTDKDYTGMVLCRDKNFQVRFHSLQIEFKNIKEAELWVFNKEKELTNNNELKMIEQKFLNNKKYDIFYPVINEDKLDKYFLVIKDQHTHSAAKKIISEIMPYFYDIDGNFIEQFQSTGFDSRIWELYLFCYFAEEGFNIDRSHNAPDFCINNGECSIGLEAVTVGRNKNIEKDNSILKYDVKSRYEVEELMPIKFGSPLYSKITHTNKNGKHYWEYEHTLNKPFVLAIADFHDDFSMTWSSTALIIYLYGYKHGHMYDEAGNLVVIPEKVENHKDGDKIIPSVFFFQSGTEHISAVLFSASGTVSKFNRIGKQCGFDEYNVTMIRNVMCYNPDPNADKPIPLTYEVSEDNSEAWGEGITVYHNPNAKIPLQNNFFESVTQAYFKNGYLEYDMPNPHVFSSFTAILAKKE